MVKEDVVEKPAQNVKLIRIAMVNWLAFKALALTPARLCHVVLTPTVNLKNTLPGVAVFPVLRRIVLPALVSPFVTESYAETTPSASSLHLVLEPLTDRPLWL